MILSLHREVLQRTSGSVNVIVATFWTLLLGWIELFRLEPSDWQMPAERRLMVSGFQAMTALMAVGIDVEQLRRSILVEPSTDNGVRIELVVGIPPTSLMDGKARRKVSFR